MKPSLSLVPVLVIAGSFAVAEAQVTRETVPGINNLARVETVVACAGAITPAAAAEIKRMGFASIINLRQASEAGADIEAHTAAATAAGLNYVHIPFNAAAPDAAVVDRFLREINEPGVQPAFIHCASGNRASAMWFVKRAITDNWDVDRAMDEATQLGLTSGALRTFMLEYVQSRKR